MIPTVQPQPDWLTPEVQEFIRQVEYDFHVCEFGEEMARVNFLPLEQRKAYLPTSSTTPSAKA